MESPIKWEKSRGYEFISPETSLWQPGTHPQLPFGPLDRDPLGLYVYDAAQGLVSSGLS